MDVITLDNFLVGLSVLDYQAVSATLYSHKKMRQTKSEKMSALGVAICEMKEADTACPELLPTAQWRQRLLTLSNRAMWRDEKPDWFATHCIPAEQRTGTDGELYSLYDRAQSSEPDPEAHLLAASLQREKDSRLTQIWNAACEICDALSAAEIIPHSDLKVFKAI